MLVEDPVEGFVDFAHPAAADWPHDVEALGNQFAGRQQVWVFGGVSISRTLEKIASGAVQLQQPLYFELDLRIAGGLSLDECVTVPIVNVQRRNEDFSNGVPLHQIVPQGKGGMRVRTGPTYFCVNSP